MIIKVFLETAGNFAERELLQRFCQGIEQAVATGTQLVNDGNEKDEVFIDIGKGHSPCDVAVIMGSWKPREKDHHLVRTSVVESSPCFVVVETPLLGRVMFQPNQQFRIGVNGFLNKAGTFFSREQVRPDRLRSLGVSWGGWKNSSSGHIVLLMQLPGDASLRGVNVFSWAKDAVKKLREKTDKRIIIRTHPGYNPKDSDEYYKFVSDMFIEKIPNIEFSNGKEKTLTEDLNNAYCTVAFTSGSSIDSVLHGIPTIASDPGNFAYDISTNFISEVNNLKMENTNTITLWLERLSYSQWSIDEMQNGQVWRHLNPTLVDILSKVPRKGKK